MRSTVDWLKSCTGGGTGMAVSAGEGEGCPTMTGALQERHCPVRPAYSSFTMAVTPQLHVTLIAKKTPPGMKYMQRMNYEIAKFKTSSAARRRKSRGADLINPEECLHLGLHKRGPLNNFQIIRPKHAEIKNMVQIAVVWSYGISTAGKRDSYFKKAE